jgi:protein-disulfide isomerase
MLDKIITESGLSTEALAECMSSPAVTGVIEENVDEGKRLGVTATPTFFLNNIRYEGVMPYYQFAGTIRKMLAKIEYDKN